jgi:hypothetical protein
MYTLNISKIQIFVKLDCNVNFNMKMMVDMLYSKDFGVNFSIKQLIV